MGDRNTIQLEERKYSEKVKRRSLVNPLSTCSPLLFPFLRSRIPFSCKATISRFTVAIDLWMVLLKLSCVI